MPSGPRCSLIVETESLLFRRFFPGGDFLRVGFDRTPIVRRQHAIQDILRVGDFRRGQFAPAGAIARRFLDIHIAGPLSAKDPAVGSGAAGFLFALTRASSATLSGAAGLFQFLDQLVQIGDDVVLQFLDSLSAACQVEAAL